MPADVQDAFEEFDEALKLDTNEREDAKNTHRKIRVWLDDQGVTAGSILQGSFARKTMLSPLRDRDVDIVAFLKASDSDPRGSPDQAMDLVEDALRKLYTSVEFSRSRHAVKLDFGADKPNFDVVPAYDRNDGSKLIDIANRDSGGWDASDTRIIIDKVSEHNQKCGRKFIHQVRMLKHWGKRVFGEDIPGFALECIAYQVIDEDREHAEALGEVFKVGADLVKAGEVKVPGGDENILDRLSEEQKKQLANEMENARIRSLETIECIKNDEYQAAIGIWHEIFGEPFPKPLEGSSGDFWSATGLTSAGHPTSSTRPHSPLSRTRSWLSPNDNLSCYTHDNKFANVGLEDNNMIGMNYLLDYPEEVCAYISSRNGPYYVLKADVISYRATLVIKVLMQPVPNLREVGFPIETIKIIVSPKYRWIRTFPYKGSRRKWYHRNLRGDLCLWYPQDPRPLRWEWEDGFILYLGIVSRHLQAEEWYRLYRSWPFEDAPHGHGPGGSPHPILTNQLRKEVRKLQ